MEHTLNGKVVLVTGGGSGLGEATARAFVRAGASVACLDLNDAGAARVADDLAHQGAQSLALRCDVGDADSVTAAVGGVVERFGRIDVAVNCAAVDFVCSVADMTVEQWDRVMSVNLRGPFLV